MLAQGGFVERDLQLLEALQLVVNAPQEEVAAGAQADGRVGNDDGAALLGTDGRPPRIRPWRGLVRLRAASGTCRRVGRRRTRPTVSAREVTGRRAWRVRALAVGTS